MYDEWGGKVALEIFVTHSCEPDKVKAFESHNIPILEVKIADSIRFRKELNKQAFTPEDLEDYFEKLRAIFSQQVFAKVLSNPLVTQYSRAVIKKLENTLDSSNDSMTRATREVTLLERELARNKQQVEQLKISQTQELESFQSKLHERQESFEQSKLALHQQYQSQIGISKLYTAMGIVFTGVLTTLMLFLLALPHINYELAAALVVDYFNWISN
jgi:succinyl-CoA synthetase beta subunit